MSLDLYEDLLWTESVEMAEQTKLQTALIDQIYASKNVDFLRDLVKRGAKVNTPDTRGNIPLLSAVLVKKPRFVEFLLGQGADPNVNNTQVLWEAIEIDHIEILQMLVAKGANVNVKDTNGEPLIFKVRNTAKLDYLLNHGVDPNSRNRIGSTILSEMVQVGNKPIVELLLKKGADINAQNTQNGSTPLHQAVFMNRDQFVDLLLKNRANPNVANTIGEKPIDAAIVNDNVKSVDLLFAAKAVVDEHTLRHFLRLGKKLKYYSMILSRLKKDQINAKDAEGKPMFFYVLEAFPRFNDVKFVKDYLAAGGDINAKDSKGMNAFSLKETLGSSDLLDLLLENGLNVSSYGAGAFKTLMLSDSKVENLQRIVRAGGDINTKDEKGITPLQFAIYNNKHMYIDPLLSLGADINALTNNDMNALHLLLLSPHHTHTPSLIELVKKLIEKGVDYNKKAFHDITPFQAAIELAITHIRNTPVALYLLSLPDIDYTTTNSDRNVSPLEKAAKYSLLEILRGMVEKGIDLSKPLSNGKTLQKNAEAGEYEPAINEYILNELSPNTSGLWRGYTQSDLEKFDTIFEIEPNEQGRIPAANVSLCPVCHEFVFRGEACKYMYHNCSMTGHMYHRRLYNLYKTEDGRIWWCIVCGRICHGHRHYSLSTSSGGKPALVIAGAGADLYSDDCTGPERGGGIKEKLRRFRRLREVSKELNGQIGTISVKKAFERQVEATWDAAIHLGVNTASMFTAKKYNIPASNFPVNKAVFPTNAPPKPNWNAQIFPDVVRTAEEAAGYEPPKIVTGKNHGGSQNDGVPVIQFHHVRQDGTVNAHEGRYISAEYLEMWLGSMIAGYQDTKFGYCWDYGQGCTARLFPDEVKPYVEADMYEEYKRKFNWKFAPQAGGGGSIDFFHHTENAICGLPPRSKGGKRDTRKRKQRHMYRTRKYTKRKN